MKKQILLATLLLVTSHAWATDPKPPVSVTPNLQVETNLDLSANVGAKAGAISGSKSYSDSDSKSGALAGSASESGGNTLQTGSQYSTSTSSNRFLNLPSHVVPVPPSIISGANVVQSVGTCGVLQQVMQEPIQGTFHGLFWDSKVSLGNREVLTSFRDENGNVQLFREYTRGNVTYIIGHQPVILSSVVSTGGARQFGLGGNSSSGNNGSGSLGTSGSNQQMVEHIQLMDCVFQMIDNTPLPKNEVAPLPRITKKLGE